MVYCCDKIQVQNLISSKSMKEYVKILDLGLVACCRGAHLSFLSYPIHSSKLGEDFSKFLNFIPILLFVPPQNPIVLLWSSRPCQCESIVKLLLWFTKVQL
jgi:hypothetical protein